MKIRSIPLGEPDNNDIRVWRYCSDGEFRMKSAYYVARFLQNPDVMAGECSISGSKFWLSNWRANVPPKVRLRIEVLDGGFSY